MISKFFIERPVLANVIAILMVVIGIVSLFALPVAQYPNVVPPTVSGDHPLSRRQRPHRDRHGGTADRAAGQRRRGHALHAVLRRRRRQLFADRHLRDRHRPQRGAGAGAEPRVVGDGGIAAIGAGAGRQRPEEVDGDPGDRDADVAGRTLRQPLSQQLCDDPAEGRDRPPARRRQRQRVRRRPVLDARLARPRQDAGARPDGAGRHPGAAAAERAGHRRADGRAAGAGRPVLPVHARRVEPPRRSRRSSAR